MNVIISNPMYSKIYLKKRKRAQTLRNAIIICDKIACSITMAYFCQFHGNVVKCPESGVLGLKRPCTNYMSTLTKNQKDRVECLQNAYIILNFIRAKCMFSIYKYEEIYFPRKLYTMEERLIISYQNRGISVDGQKYLAKSEQKCRGNETVVFRNEKYDKDDDTQHHSCMRNICLDTDCIIRTQKFKKDHKGMFELEMWFSRLYELFGNVENFKRSILRVNKKAYEPCDQWYDHIKPSAVDAYAILVSSLK